MRVDGGFDIYPALDSSWQDLYDYFLEEILQKCKDAVHLITGKKLSSALSGSRGESHPENARPSHFSQAHDKGTQA